MERRGRRPRPAPVIVRAAGAPAWRRRPGVRRGPARDRRRAALIRSRGRAASPAGRSAVVGVWTARDATGATCRVQLSTRRPSTSTGPPPPAAPTATSPRVTAWDFRDGEVYLYQPGGAVAARLRAGGRGLEGVLAKSGAPLPWPADRCDDQAAVVRLADCSVRRPLA